ncbi:EF-hand domain-containing protein [Rhodovulum steppense]|uniref:EF hand domain-containing protein n=1 Tax=Rhodovulum steppense TaxID=540251 RepID=A0A4R1YX36_9RHOB|nr:EF-hand domain-containing protein [Rhodovulum steppense]TCM85770.1 EF hand domain-containing protein [Rhodovulum steppense]
MPRLVPTALLFALVAGAAGAAGHHSLEGRFVAGWDGNGDGVVTLAEIMRIPPAVFARFDLDGNGILDPRETARFDAARQADLRAVGGRTGPEIARLAAGLRLKRNDIDGNGRISRDEFRLGGADWLALLDRNGDGVVSAADFVPR